MTPGKLQQYTSLLMTRADRNLRESELNLSAGAYNVASSQAYYAMHDVACALLASRGIPRGNDQQVIAAFASSFTDNMDIDPRLSENFQQAYRTRIACGYDSRHTETRRSAQEILMNAEEFVEAAKVQIKVELERLELPDLRKGRPGAASENL